MKPNALIFDLDDTLIDTRRRHYHIVTDFLKLNGITNSLSFNEYVNIRRENSFTNLQLLMHFYSAERIEDRFKLFWKENIENPKYLSLDELIVDLDLLKNISIENDLYILSLRSNHFNALNQVKSFPFYKLFKKILFLDYQNERNPKTNELLILRQLYHQIRFIGDSESDKEAAINSSVNFVLVLTGIYKITNTTFFFDVNNFLKTNLNHE